MNKNQHEVLELAAQTESLLNLYLQAKRELNLALGFTAVDVAKFPIVETVRAQIKVVRNGLVEEMLAKKQAEHRNGIGKGE